MKKIILLLIPAFFCLTNVGAQTHVKDSLKQLLQKEKTDEFRTLFVQNVDLKIESLSNSKNINYSIDECAIQIETIDYENSNDEIVTITLPTSGAMLKKNGALYYKTKAIKETIKNKITKLITINLYENSKDIGLLLKLKNKKQTSDFINKYIRG